MACENPASQSGRVRNVGAKGIPVISEQKLDELLASALPGVLKTDSAPIVVSLVPEIVVPVQSLDGPAPVVRSPIAAAS